jgi:hypothetical protein
MYLLIRPLRIASPESCHPEQLVSRCELRLGGIAANSLTRDFREAEANLLILFIKFFIQPFCSSGAKRNRGPQRQVFVAGVGSEVEGSAVAFALIRVNPIGPDQ